MRTACKNRREPELSCDRQYPHNDGDKDELSDFNADVEREQCNRDVASRQADLCQRAGKPKSVEKRFLGFEWGRDRD